MREHYLGLYNDITIPSHSSQSQVVVHRMMFHCFERAEKFVIRFNGRQLGGQCIQQRTMMRIYSYYRI